MWLTVCAAPWKRSGRRGGGKGGGEKKKKALSNWPCARTRHSTSSRLLLVSSGAADVYKHANPSSSSLPSNILIAGYVGARMGGRPGSDRGRFEQNQSKKKKKEQKGSDAASASCQHHLLFASTHGESVIYSLSVQLSARFCVQPKKKGKKRCISFRSCV